MFKFIIFILLFIVLACNQKQAHTDTKLLDFGLFTIETPKSWTKLKEQGIDSYGGRIAIDSNDTLEFDLGWYSNTLSEAEPNIVERSQLQYFKQQPPDTTNLIIVESRKGIDPDRYKKNNIEWDTIDARIAKIVYPIKSGTGITGVYIDSLWKVGSDIDRFNLYGNNLKPDNEKKVLQVLRTLKFHKK